MILDDYIQSYLQDHLRPLVHVGSRGVAFQYSTHTKVQARVYTNIEIHHACVQSPLQKNEHPRPPTIPGLVLDLISIIIVKGPHWRSCLVLGRKDLSHPSIQCLRTLSPLGQVRSSSCIVLPIANTPSLQSATQLQSCVCMAQNWSANWMINGQH